MKAEKSEKDSQDPSAAVESPELEGPTQPAPSTRPSICLVAPESPVPTTEPGQYPSLPHCPANQQELKYPEEAQNPEDLVEDEQYDTQEHETIPSHGALPDWEYLYAYDLQKSNYQAPCPRPSISLDAQLEKTTADSPGPAPKSLLSLVLSGEGDYPTSPMNPGPNKFNRKHSPSLELLTDELSRKPVSITFAQIMNRYQPPVRHPYLGQSQSREHTSSACFTGRNHQSKYWKQASTDDFVEDGIQQMLPTLPQPVQSARSAQRTPKDRSPEQRVYKPTLLKAVDASSPDPVLVTSTIASASCLSCGMVSKDLGPSPKAEVNELVPPTTDRTIQLRQERMKLYGWWFEETHLPFNHSINYENWTTKQFEEFAIQFLPLDVVIVLVKENLDGSKMDKIRCGDTGLLGHLHAGSNGKFSLEHWNLIKENIEDIWAYKRYKKKKKELRNAI
ncbi:Protein CBG21617 [Caenorhabditis briggsae]|uniref:Protein CBG21617 n=3 Tax=Caenorhabditis briggsae TaxID=6238 RepID=A8Y079_CAEBR|nr:Protein CBG21617 [Caenorhabditis briggsae]CAP38369.2 Protein CBG21617 [Caenorhabditis briggsae]